MLDLLFEKRTAEQFRKQQPPDALRAVVFPYVHPPYSPFVPVFKPFATSEAGGSDEPRAVEGPQQKPVCANAPETRGHGFARGSSKFFGGFGERARNPLQGFQADFAERFRILRRKRPNGYVRHPPFTTAPCKLASLLLFMRCAVVAALLAFSLAGRAQTDLADPDPAEQKKILGDATEYALHHEMSLPNFLCTQTTQRFEDASGSGNWRSIDLIVERLTYFEHREEYKVFMVNGLPSNVAHEALGGATSSGEFGSVLKGIFWPESHTQFNWERFFTLRGRKMHVYSYRVPVTRSDYHIVVPREKLDLVAAYHGLIFIDAATHSVYRITLHADGVPASFPVQDVSLALDYDYTRIGDAEYLLPLEFELRSRERRWLVKNDVTYSDYRKFGADSSVTFEDPNKK